MAKITLEILSVLRNTAHNLEKSTQYQWGHMGCCNCGFLAQEISLLRKEEIHARAMQGHGDWSEQLNDYCPGSGLLMDNLISEMLSYGFDSDDLMHLERLSDPQIIRTFPNSGKDLKHNVKADVIRYLKAWADMIQEQLIARVKLPDLEKDQQPVYHRNRKSIQSLG